MSALPRSTSSSAMRRWRATSRSLFIKYQWKAEKNEPVFEVNPDFGPAVMAELYAPTDTLLVTCRSGGRSALAVNGLAKAGFTNVYNIIDGFEGDMVAEDGQPLSRQADEERLEELRSRRGRTTCDPDLLWIVKTSRPIRTGGVRHGC